MINELIFIIQNLFITAVSIGAFLYGQTQLITFVALCWIMSNLFVLKQVTLFGMSVVTSDVCMVGANLGIGLLRHYFGQKAAEEAIWTGTLASFFFMLMSLFLLAYQPNTFDCTHAHYAVLLTPVARLVICSFIVAIISTHAHLWLYNKFMSLFKNPSLYLVNTSALLISQLIDTVLFSVFGMYGLVHSIIPIIIFSYSIKIISIMLCTPLTSINFSKWRS